MPCRPQHRRDASERSRTAEAAALLLPQDRGRRDRPDERILIEPRLIVRET